MQPSQLPSGSSAAPKRALTCHALPGLYPAAVAAGGAAGPVAAACYVEDEFLAPLLDGLAANTHLHRLRCSGNSPIEALARDRLAPAKAALAARTALDEE